MTDVMYVVNNDFSIINIKNYGYFGLVELKIFAYIESQTR